jgi:nucleoid DNA-binding protein
MTTGEIVKQLASRMGITQVEAKKIVETLFSEIALHLAQDKNIILRDFGTFGCKQVPQQRRLLPGTNNLCDIPSHKKLFFRTAKKLKGQLNAPSE